MSIIVVELGTFPSGQGGNYSYEIRKNGVGVKVVTGITNLNNAWDAIKADLVTVLSTETPSLVTIHVQAN